MAETISDKVEAKKTRAITEQPAARPDVIPAAHALTGAVACLLLGLIEVADVNVRFSDQFTSVADRMAFASFISINVVSGLVIGFTVGLVALIVSVAHHHTCRVASRWLGPRWLVWTGGAVGLSGVSAFLLNQHPQVYGYVLGLIREVEKFSSFRETLLNHERATSYLTVMALFMICGLIWLVSRACAAMPRALRLLWMVVLAGALALAYWVDSRVELHLYERTMHRSLFLAGLVLSMGLVGSFYHSVGWFRMPPYVRKAILLPAFLILVGHLAFTFVTFDRDHNLKTLASFRTTQTKQHVRLAQWALDFDRDGYSPFLGGGDADDRRGDINPGEPERIDDGIDNNTVGGDLTGSELEEWRAQFTSLRPVAPSGDRRLNVIFLFIDTLRADRMGAYGYTRNTSPNMDRLAERSTLFVNAFSPSPRTSEAVQKFMQSNYWDGHLDSWTQVLQRNGYETMLFPGVRSWERYKEWMPVVKEAQGTQLKANMDITLKVLGERRNDTPFCAYVYIPDPHRPYKPHEQFDFGPSTSDRYDGEVAYTDYHVGRLLNWMEESGRIDDTLVVIMSDHGESLGERGIFRHSTQLYNEQVRVPMIVYVPGHEPRRVDEYVSTIYLGSTIVDAVGLEYPPECLGFSLMPVIRGGRMQFPPVYGEQTGMEISPHVRLDQQIHPETKKYMVIAQDGFKIIYNRDSYCFELFDLKNDPDERRNLFSLLPDKAERMKFLVGRFVDVVTVSRPWDADESRYSRAGAIDGDKVEE